MSYRIRFTLPGGRTGHFMRDYGTREDAQRAIEQAIDDRKANTVLAYTVEEVATPEARIRELEAELAQLRVGYDVANREVAHLREAYDAARQDLDVAERKVARLESTLAMVQASWAASVASADVARAASAEAHRKAVVSVVKLDRALALGDAMHRAHPSEDWAEYKNSLAASRQGPAKASEAPGEGHHSGEGEK